MNHSELFNRQVGNLSIAYQDAGEGYPVLLAHCSSASHKEWAFVSGDLAKSRRVIAPDLINYGKSDAWSGDSPMPHDADVRVLGSFLDMLDEPIDLIGHSYGVAMCLEAARRHSVAGTV